MKAIELYRNNNQIILVTAIKFEDLREKIKFTKRDNSGLSEFEDKDETRYYQRTTNEIRVKGIKKFISNSLFEKESKRDVLFPSTMILSVEDIDNDFEINENTVDFYFPAQNESCLIVDGQHRMRAMISLYDDLVSEKNQDKLSSLLGYKLNCTILINYDLWQQARIFANVNFNQKPVDKSLYFDIFGEVPKDGKDEKLSDLYVAHELGKYLNTSNKSPLKGFVKNFNSKQGFISQAFFTQAILDHLGPRGVWSNVTEDYKHDGTLYENLPKIFIAFFLELKKILSNYWPVSLEKKDATLLVKTNSLGALIKLLGWIDRMLSLGLFPNKGKIKLLELSQHELESLFNEILNGLNKVDKSNLIKAEKYFGNNSRYSSGGSAGLQSQLFKELAFEIGIPVEKKVVNEIN